MGGKILQIMPADGWCAVYRDSKGVKYTNPIIGFALVEEPDGTRYVSGFDMDDGTTSFNADDENHIGYARGLDQP